MVNQVHAKYFESYSNLDYLSNFFSCYLNQYWSCKEIGFSLRICLKLNFNFGFKGRLFNSLNFFCCGISAVRWKFDENSKNLFFLFFCTF